MVKIQKMIDIDYLKGKSDDIILNCIAEFIDHDYSFKNRIKEFSLIGFWTVFEGLEDIKKALALLQTDKAKLFFLEKVKYSVGFCKDIIPTLQPFNIIYVLEKQFEYSSNDHKKGVDKGIFYKYEYDLCEIAIPFLAGDQNSLLKIINMGKENFVHSHPTYKLFKNSLKYLSIESFKKCFDFFGWDNSLSDSEYKILPDEILIEMIRKNNYDGYVTIYIYQMYNKKFLTEICEKTLEEDVRERVKKRIQEL